MLNVVSFQNDDELSSGAGIHLSDAKTGEVTNRMRKLSNVSRRGLYTVGTGSAGALAPNRHQDNSRANVD